LSFVIPADADRYHSHFVGVLETAETLTCELELLRGDGSHVHVRLDSLRLINDGQAPMLRVVLTDITERKQKEHDLQNSQKRLARAEIIAHVGNWSYEVADKSVVWSDELWNIYGRKPHSDELTYDICTSWIREDFRAFHHEKHNQMLALKPGETVKDFSFCLVRPDGEQRWVKIFLEAEFDQGTPVRFFGIVEDITEGKQVEATLSRYQKNLETVVAERTKELRLVARQLLTTEARGRSMLATELHDQLGQNLAFAKLKLGLLARPGECQTSADYLQTLKEAEALLENAIVSVRSFSTQLNPLSLSQFGLHAALESLAEDFLRVWGLRIKLHLCDPMPLNETTAATLFGIVRELLHNILKHAQVSAAELILALDADGKMLEISVIDDGIGFDVEQKFSVSSELSYGLGSIRQRIELIGGEMSIDSQLGNGTIVTLKLIPEQDHQQ
jgi:PAS domain S-box-containing protein